MYFFITTVALHFLFEEYRAHFSAQNILDILFKENIFFHFSFPTCAL